MKQSRSRLSQVAKRSTECGLYGRSIVPKMFGLSRTSSLCGHASIMIAGPLRDDFAKSVDGKQGGCALKAHALKVSNNDA